MTKQLFRYKYQTHPFDEAHYFTVEAFTQIEANVLATKEFTGMFERGLTVMTVFYPC